MKTTITLNMKKRTIEMTKTFANAASRFGTDAYNDLQQVRRDYPNYTVVIVNRQSGEKKEHFKGLDYNYMEKYIKAHDDEKQSIMKEYKNLRGLSEEAQELEADSLSYGEMRKWFLKKFPAISDFFEKREKALGA
mgnify:CR=1 FL=1